MNLKIKKTILALLMSILAFGIMHIFFNLSLIGFIVGETIIILFDYIYAYIIEKSEPWEK